MAAMTTEAATTLHESFLSLVGEHERLLHKICHLYCRSEEERRDLLQEILLQLWRSLPAFERRAGPSTWVYRVALNTGITFLRRKCRLGPESVSQGIETVVFDDVEFQRVENAEVLERALAVLTSVERAIVLLYFEEKSYGEISEILGISEKGVSVKLVRIKDKLRGWFQGAR